MILGYYFWFWDILFINPKKTIKLDEVKINKVYFVHDWRSWSGDSFEIPLVYMCVIMVQMSGIDDKIEFS